jgi:hypothetical protein
MLKGKPMSKSYDADYQRAKDAWNRWKNLDERAAKDPEDGRLRMLAWQAKRDYDEAARVLNQYFLAPTAANLKY